MKLNYSSIPTITYWIKKKYCQKNDWAAIAFKDDLGGDSIIIITSGKDKS